MEQFMLIFNGPSNPDTQYYGGPEAMQAQMEKWFAWIEDLRKNGRYVSGEALLPERKIVTSRKSATDGPFTEGKEIVAGYFVINAKDFDEAIEISKAGYPDFEFGSKVEVRQVMKLQ